VTQSAGSGGVQRGRGDAPWAWGQETQGSSDRFRIEFLPEGGALDLENSHILGVGAVAPPVDAVGQAGGLASVETSSGKAAWRRRLSPSHRSAVQSFFAPRD